MQHTDAATGRPRMRTLHAQVVDDLGRRIIGGEYAPGQQLPPEDQLAELVGISKGALREVVKSLSAKGLLAVRPRIGMIVTPRSEWNLLDPQLLNWHLDMPGAPLAEELLELRVLIEPEVARLACERADSERIDLVVDASDRMRRAAELGETGRTEFLEADLAFHQNLLRASGNALIAQLARLLAGAFRQGFDTTFHVPGSVSESLPMHAAIATALKERDGEFAANEVRKLIRHSSESLFARRLHEPSKGQVDGGSTSEATG